MGKLHWQCRRGMLELDFVLQRYLDEHYETAAEEDRALFRDLLSAQDPELQAWILNGFPHPDARYQRLIDKMRGF